jgi:hypothetical protein
LRLELAFAGQRLRFKELKLTSAAASLNGSGEVDLAKQSLDWRLQVSPGAADAGDVMGAKSAEPSRGGASLSIKGPWTSPAVEFGKMPEKSRRDGAAMGPLTGNRNL